MSLRDVLELLRSDACVQGLLEAVDQPAPSQSGRLGAPYRAARASEPVEIVLLDDDVSTMDGVLALLGDCFCKGHAEALHLMLISQGDGTHSADFGISDIERVSIAGQTAGLSERTLPQAAIDNVFPAVTGKGQQFVFLEIKAPYLVMPRHGDVELIFQQEQIPRAVQTSL